MSEAAANFEAESPYESPWTEIRGGNPEEISSWRSLALPQPLRGWRWVEIRLTAAANPIELGASFLGRTHDTGHPRGPQQWTFTSPTGEVTTVEADPVGEFSWEVSFRPSLPGPEKWPGRAPGPRTRTAGIR